MLQKIIAITLSVVMTQAIQDKKITKETLGGEIADVRYTQIGDTLTHCAITTHSGFVFTGESACVDKAQFDKTIGEKIAYENAFEKMWLPYGFLLNQLLQGKQEN